MDVVMAEWWVHKDPRPSSILHYDKNDPREARGFYPPFATTISYFSNVGSPTMILDQIAHFTKLNGVNPNKGAHVEIPKG